MDAVTVKAIATAYSMKKEIKYVFITFLVILLLPVFAVITLTQVGLDVVSGAIVSRNPQLAQVDIRDPKTGAIIDYIAEPVVWPVTGPVTLEFGHPSPYQLFHTGIDIADPAGKVGTPVGAFMRGKVIYANTISWGYGRHVIIDHGKRVTSVYAHLDTLAVDVGQEVELGQVVGTRGNTGWSTGPHLHLQINVFYIPVNPRVFLAGNP